MSRIGMRMNKLKSLLNLRNGPGAAKLPENVTKIHLEFVQKWSDGHKGPSKFWKESLPRLKYHNPAVPMIVNRTDEQAGPATLSIYMSGGGQQQQQQPEPEQTEGPAGPTPRRAPETADAWRTIASSTTGTARAPPPAEGETVVTINMKHVQLGEIMRQFMDRTGAREVPPSAEDQKEMERLRELRERAAHDQQVQKSYRQKIKAEKRLLERARQEADALKSDK